ncbi:MAG: precorrin-8X methylmutase [Candidatus Melainabacteria bacterium]|nr:precorrin-8X methylmutase [Candidatus Melainabacteria bacterium]
MNRSEFDHSKINQAGAYSVVLAGHGSRDPDGVQEFEEMVELLRFELNGRLLHYGYLEFSKPSIAEAVRASIDAGARKVVVVPALLFAAGHAKNDMPAELNSLRQEFSQIEIAYGAIMDLHPLLLELARERIIQAESASPNMARRADTCLVVVGRGTSDSDANSEISKLCRMLEEGMGFGTSFVCYSGTAKPLVAAGLKAAAKLGHKRIIVLPFLLFNGVLVKRVRAAAQVLQERHPELEVLTSHYMGVHPYVARVFAERAIEGAEGRATMDCSLCKYRVQIVGFERQLGEAQKSNHIKSEMPSSGEAIEPYQPHPIEAESMAIINSGRDWSGYEGLTKAIAMRLVHTSGDFAVPETLFFSPGAAEMGVRALLRCRRIVCDVSMVESGLKRALLKSLAITTWCGVHEDEAYLLARECGITRSAAGIRLAFEKFGNDVVVAIGDAPTAVVEAVRLIEEQHWRPQLLIGLPVGFVGTAASKEKLSKCLQVPRITNFGTSGGSPWAAAVINAMLIECTRQVSVTA